METSSKIFLCSFVLIQKNQKIKTANKLLNFYSISWQRINSSRLLLYSFERDSNSILCFSFHYVKIFNVIYLRSLLPTIFNPECLQFRHFKGNRLSSCEMTIASRRHFNFNSHLKFLLRLKKKAVLRKRFKPGLQVPLTNR